MNSIKAHTVPDGYDLQLEPYCNHCKDFSVEVLCNQYYMDNEMILMDHIITCEHRDKCKAMYEHIRKELMPNA